MIFFQIIEYSILFTNDTFECPTFFLNVHFTGDDSQNINTIQMSSLFSDYQINMEEPKAKRIQECTQSRLAEKTFSSQSFWLQLLQESSQAKTPTTY